MDKILKELDKQSSDMLFSVKVKSDNTDIDKYDLNKEEFISILKDVSKINDEWIQEKLESNHLLMGSSYAGKEFSLDAYRKIEEHKESGLHRCPRRDEAFGIGDSFIDDERTLEKPDHWNKIGEDRVCSCCGSIHPEDLNKRIKELGQGIIEPSTKGYKLYINLPNVSNASQGAIKFYKHHWTTEEGKKAHEELLKIIGK